MIHSKIMETTKSILKEFGNTYFSDKGTLKRNKVIEDLDAYTPMLMKALLANQLIHDTYTESVVIDDKSVEIFKLNQFIEMFTYKEYWQDSYTKFENKIGLTAGGKFIDETADVVLDFPFKDTVLKAGMTKEDQKDADEPFLHETIAKAEIDQLLEPKIFVNATKYDQENLDGTSVDNFDDDNLIIKGNNLIALHSLKERYAGKVKLIYLDPPYNTRGDSFLYNDRFSETSWLTFIKNRLEIAYSLLSNDGIIFIQSDDNEQAYLKLLTANIFGNDNFVATVPVVSNLKGNQDQYGFAGTHEYLTVFTKDKKITQFNNLIIDDEELNDWLEDEVGYYKKGANLKATGVNAPRNKRPNLYFPVYIQPDTLSISLKEKQGYINVLPITDGQDMSWRWQKDTMQRLINDIIVIPNDKGFSLYKKQRPELGDLPSKKPKSIFYKPEYSSGNGTNQIKKLFNNKIFSFPKPEQLISDILQIGSNENDTILDFFMGSATTQAVAMKMNRRFIGIEQMDYIKTVSVERLKKVIAGEQGGISKDVNWQGGGSFVYAELMEKNQGYLKDVQQAETTKQLEDVVHRMIASGADFDFRVDVEKVLQDPEYKAMALADKKQLIVKVIDKNQLYYAYSDMDDCDVQELMSESDIAFNKSFYGERDL
ncbi:site-specific DNA-methyltransferase [Loigolactobacillus backii]|uniref:site-specific DNA-methyltransferase n=1 Tax=Loigolactobacillus backii TaxID=375175 RepID=UPI000F7A8F05|nr:site-specific DNA-methyltransferase [Loigolactobacillus backii]